MVKIDNKTAYTEALRAVELLDNVEHKLFFTDLHIWDMRDNEQNAFKALELALKEFKALSRLLEQKQFNQLNNQ